MQAVSTEAIEVCTSVCMSAYQSKLEPENEYLLISAKPAWTLLERVDQEDVGHAKALWWAVNS